MQRALESGLVAGTIHVIKHVVHGHHVRTGQISRQPEQVRNVHQVAMQALEDGAVIEIALDGGVVAQQRYGVKIRRERADLRHFFRRADQKVFALVSSRPSARTILRVYVPTPNSVMRRISMATLTGDLTTEDPVRPANGGRASSPSGLKSSRKFDPGRAGRPSSTYARTSTCAFARRSGYSGKASARLNTCLRIFAEHRRVGAMMQRFGDPASRPASSLLPSCRGW